MSQCTQIFAYMKNHDGITPAEAVAHIKPPCYRLAARIKDLRDMGYDIITDDIRTKNGSYARYRLGGKA